MFSPYLAQDVNLLESFQRVFTKRIFFKHGLGNDVSYKDRLHFLKLDSLERRRLIADLVFLYKILHNCVDIEAADFFRFFDHKHATRGNAFNVSTKFVGRTEVDNNFFTHRVERFWNALPSEIKCCTTIAKFSALLSKYSFEHRVFDTKLRDFS